MDPVLILMINENICKLYPSLDILFILTKIMFIFIPIYSYVPLINHRLNQLFLT